MHTGGVDAGAWGIVAVLVIGTAVVVYGWFSDRAATRRDLEAMQRAPDRQIPRFEPHDTRPQYLSELEAATRPSHLPEPTLAADTRDSLSGRLTGSPSFPAGLPDRGFVTDPATGWCVLEQPLILVCAEPVTAIRELLPAVRRAREADRGLVVVAPEIAVDVQATLRANLVQGKLDSLPILLADAGLRRSLCSLTGGELVPVSDLRAGYLPAAHLGTCLTWVSDKDTSWVVLDDTGLK